MTYTPGNHHRRSIRLNGYDYSQAGAYFATICAKDKECLFGDIVGGEMMLNDAGVMVRGTWNNLTVKYPGIEIDEFIVMPNHIHGIIIVHPGPVGAIQELPLQNETISEIRKHRRQMLLSKIIGRFKMNTAKQINQSRNTSGTPVWQRNYYEHVIRDDDALDRIRKYIIENPAKWAGDKDNPANIVHRRGNS